MSPPRHCCYLDVSDLPPPEPMAVVLEAAQKLEPGRYIHMHHWREPLLLYERLLRIGFSCDARLGADQSCEIFIWKTDDVLGAELAARAADKLLKWDD